MALLIWPVALVVGWWIRLAVWVRRAVMQPLSPDVRVALADTFDEGTLDGMRVVVGRPPVPGIARLVKLFWPNRVVTEPAGITFGNCVVVRPGLETSTSLIHHELVHVVQWRELGWTRFLLVYLVGVVRHGYLGCPLEEIAYGLTAAWEARGRRTGDARTANPQAAKTEALAIQHTHEQAAALRSTWAGRLAWWLAKW